MIAVRGPLVLGLLALAGLMAPHSAAATPRQANPAYDPQADLLSPCFVQAQRREAWGSHHTTLRSA
jgi:hypothetical protein